MTYIGSQKGKLEWRLHSASDTYELILKNRARFGVARLVDITGLDCIGIPVYLAIRPRGKSMSVSAGKGITHIESMVSALMESIEIDVAERVHDDHHRFCRFVDIDPEHSIDFNLFPRISTAPVNELSYINWVAGYELGTHDIRYIPQQLVSMDIRLHEESMSSFAWGTNGLASSCILSEAILSGVYEIIERDTLTCWSFIRSKNRRIREFVIDEESIPFDSTKTLIKTILESKLNIFLIYLPNELNIPVVKCHILNNIDPARASASGYGCHHNIEVALNRAITEAVQGRCCYIAGSREDMFKAKYNSVDYGYALDYFSELIPEALEIENKVSLSTDEAIEDIVSKSDQQGWLRPIAYVYKSTDPFSVVKIFWPSLASTSFSTMTLRHERLRLFKAPRTAYQLLCDSLNAD